MQSGVGPREALKFKNGVTQQHEPEFPETAPALTFERGGHAAHNFGLWCHSDSKLANIQWAKG